MLFKAARADPRATKTGRLPMVRPKVPPGPLHNRAPVCYRVRRWPFSGPWRAGPADGGSSNGRTADSDSASLGSNPSPPATLFSSLDGILNKRRSLYRPHVGTRVDIEPIRGTGR